MVGVSPVGSLPVAAFSGATGKTLSADPGSYALVGAAASIRVGRLLRAYNDLIVNGAFPADTSGWTVNGTDTVFAAAAGEGVLTLGPAAAGGYAYQAITVVPGKPYTLSGLLRSTKTYSMTITPGSYALVGTDVTLTKGNAATIHDQSLSISHAGSVGIGYTLQHDGTAVKSDNISGVSFLETWLPSGASASSYDVRATRLSGVSGSGTYGFWLNLASDQDWGITESFVGTISTVILIELAHAGTGVAFTSATITLTATRTS